MDTKSNNVICSKTWTDLNINLTTNEVYYCCKSTPEKMRSLSIEDIIYAPGIVQRRQDSINGIKNSQCEHCWKTNGAYRNIHNKLMPIPDDPEDAIEFIELTLENTCNLSCLYCNEKYSSKIAKEKGLEVSYNKVNYNVDDICDLLLSIIRRKKIQLNMIGGEPTMSKSYYKLIEKLIDQVHDCELVFITTSNGIISPHMRDKLSEYMNCTSWKWVWGFSGESANEVFNNTRFHANYETWLDNIKFFSSHNNTYAIALNPAVNNLGIKTFPTYISDVLRIIKDNKYVINGNYVNQPPEFSVSNLSVDFVKYIQEARSIFLEYSENCINTQSVLTWFDELENMIATEDYNKNLSSRLQSLNLQKQNKLDVKLLLDQTRI